MKLAIAVCVIVCALSAPGASAAPATAPSPSKATAALGRYLHQLYGGIQGSWTCPGPAISGRVDCLAEVHTGKEWHQLSPSARIRAGVIVFTALTNIAAVTWVRHWWPYSRHFILRSHESVPGVVSVNSPAYDWGWLASGASGLKDGQTRRLGAVDGYVGKGASRFFTFRCSRKGGLITCRNALGDAMRYRPHPT